MPFIRDGSFAQAEFVSYVVVEETAACSRRQSAGKEAIHPSRFPSQ